MGYSKVSEQGMEKRRWTPVFAAHRTLLSPPRKQRVPGASAEPASPVPGQRSGSAGRAGVPSRGLLPGPVLPPLLRAAGRRPARPRPGTPPARGLRDGSPAPRGLSRRHRAARARTGRSGAAATTLPAANPAMAARGLLSLRRGAGSTGCRQRFLPSPAAPGKVQRAGKAGKEWRRFDAETEFRACLFISVHKVSPSDTR